MKTAAIITAILFGQLAFAQEEEIEEKKLESQVSEVTVYFQGAQVKRVKNVKLKPGKYRLVFDGLEPDLTESSLQVHVDEGLVINYVNKRSNFLKRVEKNETEKALQKSIDSLQTLIEDEADELALYQNQEKIMALNNEIGSDVEGVKISELKQTVEYYESKLREVKAAQRKSHRSMKALKKLLQEKAAQKQELTSVVPPKTSEVIVEASCEDTFKGDITLKYIIPNAGWTPIYDLRAEGLDDPIKLILKANVRQSSGSDWKDIKLNLTSENPFESGQMPELRRWDVGAIRSTPPPKPELQPYPMMGNGTIRGNVSEAANNEPIPFANIVVMNGSEQITGASTDFDGNFKLSGIKAGRYDLKASTVGFTVQEKKGILVHGNQNSIVDFKMSAGVKLDEVVVINYTVPLISAHGTSGATFSGGRLAGGNNASAGGFSGSSSNNNTIVTGHDIQKMPSRGAAAAVTTIEGLQTSSYARGTRSDATQMYIDGVSVRGSSSLPQAAYQQVQVLTGGTPAQYGGASDGIVSISSTPIYNSSFSSAIRKRNKRININTVVAKKETRVFYKVETPFTVLSDDKDYTVQIDELEINAQMEYFSAPIEVEHAFLIAKITDWERFDLLEGLVSLYVSGTYIGQSMLEPANTGDTLLVSLGSDKSIVVEREELKDFSKQQIIGNKTVDFRGYTLKLKNNKDRLVRLHLQDQIPVSTSRDVTVSILEPEDLKVDEDKGIIDWDLMLLPGESKTLTFKYFVKRPSWKKISLE